MVSLKKKKHVLSIPVVVLNGWISYFVKFIRLSYKIKTFKKFDVHVTHKIIALLCLEIVMLSSSMSYFHYT